MKKRKNMAKKRTEALEHHFFLFFLKEVNFHKQKFFSKFPAGIELLLQQRKKLNAFEKKEEKRSIQKNY